MVGNKCNTASRSMELQAKGITDVKHVINYKNVNVKNKKEQRTMGVKRV